MCWSGALFQGEPISILKILIHELFLWLSLSVHTETMWVDNGRRFVSRIIDINGSRVYESPFFPSRLEALRLAYEYRDFLIHTRRRYFERARVNMQSMTPDTALTPEGSWSISNSPIGKERSPLRLSWRQSD